MQGGMTMRTLWTILLVVMLAIGTQAAGPTASCFVVVDKDTYYCDEVKPGKATFRLFTEGKQLMKVPAGKVTAYSVNGKLYERLPVVTRNQDTAGWAFMQFIATHDGFRLYRFCSNCVYFDPATGEIAPSTPIYRYYIFKHGKFVSLTDDQHYESQLAWFGIKLIR